MTMKLWLILYTAQGIGGTWGPLPYDMAECQSRATERMTSVQTAITTGRGENGDTLPPAVIEDIKTWRLACEEHEERPKLASEQ
jgi:hypothetical protein